MNPIVVIPAYNEENNIKKVILEAKKQVPNVIVVDDGSNDNTAEEAKKVGAIVLEHAFNLGKGAAAKTGCDFAFNNGYEQIVLMDADSQHESGEIPVFLSELKDVDVVFGYRKFNKEMPLILKSGNQFLSWVTKVLYNVKLKDTQCGYRAFTSIVYKKIRWKVFGYSMENEMIANVGKRKLKYKQIPTQTIYADKYKGTTIFDGIKIVMNMILWRFK